MTEIKVTVGSTKIVASVVQGMNGKTAYQSAVSGGYTGTEGQFNAILASIPTNASQLPFTPTGNLASTNVQTALAELDTEKAPTVHTHDDRYYTETEVNSLLNAKANTTTTVNNQPLSSNITINASGVPNTPVGNISATNVQNAINELDTEKVDKLRATNLVTNGDFSNGTTGWNAENHSTFVVENGIGKIFNNGINTVSRLARFFSFNVGRKYYTCIKKISQSGANAPFTFEIFDFTHGSKFSVHFSNNVTEWSTIFELSGSLSATSRWTFIVDVLSTNSFFTFDDIMLIDLTATFGAGNEPTRLEMDKLLSVYPNSWFNGTSEIGSIGALMRAALGVQVVTPTLLNSRTGTAQYVASNDGLVIFRGTASGGSLNTNIFVLPGNIRPIATRTFPISANNAFGVVTVAANGEVRQTAGALTNVFLDGIAFKVGV